MVFMDGDYLLHRFVSGHPTYGTGYSYFYVIFFSNC